MAGKDVRSQSKASLLNVVFVDPTLLFAVVCMIIPALKRLQENGFVVDTALREYLADPLLLAGLGVTLAIKVLHAGQSRLLPTATRTKANWYLVNGILFHLLMDVGAGGMGRLSLLAQEYRTLDARFSDPDNVLILVAGLELVLMTPMCIWAFLCIVSQRPESDVVEMVLSVLQLFGTIMYVGAEVVDGFPSVPSEDPVGPYLSNAKLNVHHAIFFWFGFVFTSAVWVVVPVMLTVGAARRAVRAQVMLQDKEKQQ